MPIIVSSVSTSLSEDNHAAIAKAIALLGVPAGAVKEACIAKTALDARKRADIHFVHTVSITLHTPEDETRAAARAGNRVSLRAEQPIEIVRGEKLLSHRPVIVGFGPAGMFAGLLLAQNGLRPLILERGGNIDSRVASVERFWREGILDSNSNVQFGEGGAGTFSDGKLTTRIGDPKCGWVLHEFVRFGAPREILYKAKPHIGTDHLRGIVKGIRAEILSLGGEIRFDTALTDLCISDGRLSAAVTPDGEIPTETLILATGHSARDTFEMLTRRGFSMEAKPFSVGVRIEHLQSEINRGLYGEHTGNPALPLGEYQLSRRVGERGVYTFCMCPGGVVVPAASEQGMTVTNGMSLYARDGVNANSALAVSVAPTDFGSGPLAGMAFQRELERRAFKAGGGGFRAPAQDVGNFLQGKAGLKLGRVQPSYALGTAACDFHRLFPKFVSELLERGLRAFGQNLTGFDASDAILTGIETRTSSPVRILRGENMQADGISGVYPCAEGAGYAGGIMSAAVDGIRAALALLGEYRT